MTKVAVVSGKECSICDKENKELLEIRKEGLFFDDHILICQSCVSKWFRAFDKKNNKVKK